MSSLEAKIVVLGAQGVGKTSLVMRYCKGAFNPAKVTSTVGLAEVIPVRRSGAMAEPLAAKYLSLATLARSDGWILVPAESEGYSAGAEVQVRPWP